SRIPSRVRSGCAGGVPLRQSRRETIRRECVGRGKKSSLLPELPGGGGVVDRREARPGSAANWAKRGNRRPERLRLWKLRGERRPPRWPSHRSGRPRENHEG